MWRPLAAKPVPASTDEPATSKDGFVPNNGSTYTESRGSMPILYHSWTSQATYPNAIGLETAQIPNMNSAREEFQLASTQQKQKHRDGTYRAEESLFDSIHARDESRRPHAAHSSHIGDHADSELEPGPGPEADGNSSFISLQNNIGRFKGLAVYGGRQFDIRSLLEDEDNQPSRDSRPRGRKKGFRGPRKPVALSPELTLRLGKANKLYLDRRIHEADAELRDIIRCNGEAPQAWDTLASVSFDLNDFSFAAFCYLMSAHLRPKIASSWLRCIEFVLDELNERDRAGCLKIAKYAASAGCRSIASDMNLRMRKGDVFDALGSTARAIEEYKTVLKTDRTSIAALEKIAHICAEHENVCTAIEEYTKSIPYLRMADCEQEFGWVQVDTYIMLYMSAGQYGAAIRELKALSRWLLGRGDEEFWDDVTDDDREWDFTDDRRLRISAFVPGKYEQSSYGLGLPLECRVTMGLARLQLGDHDEAMTHLGVLLEPNEDGESHIEVYPYLYRDAADRLFSAKLFQQALDYYQPLNSAVEGSDSSTLVQIGRCFVGLGDDKQASDNFMAAIEVNQNDIDARMELVRLHERAQQPNKAFDYVTEVIQLRNNRRSGSVTQAAEDSNHSSKSPKASQTEAKVINKPPRVYVRQAAKTPLNSKALLRTAERLQNQYRLLQSEQEAMRAGDPESCQIWMNAAKAMTDDFRSFKAFYPWDKYIKFVGYSGNAKIQAETSLDSDLKDMVERLSKDVGADVSATVTAPPADIPEDYRGISFQKWLDIFLEYALCLVRNGDPRLSYEICEAALDATVFYHSKEDVFLISLCWCMCALIASDEQACVLTARFFMKDYQFTTDSYRISAAMTRACHSPVSYYCSGPTQKFVLRQIKAMDFALKGSPHHAQQFTDKGTYTALDANGKLLINTDMDVALLIMYGHILFTSGSYTYALNYFYRAYALDPGNAMISLNIGLAYIHHALKRQTENRQYTMVQGFGFMQIYYEIRIQSKHAVERLEAHHNMARVYHMLGLVHLAIPFYSKVLEESQSTDGKASYESLVYDSAYNLQAIYALSGNAELSRKVTKQWLVL